jgi:hypothetical protein
LVVARVRTKTLRRAYKLCTTTSAYFLAPAPHFEKSKPQMKLAISQMMMTVMTNCAKSGG